MSLLNNFNQNLSFVKDIYVIGKKMAWNGHKMAICHYVFYASDVTYISKYWVKYKIKFWV